MPVVRSKPDRITALLGGSRPKRVSVPKLAAELKAALGIDLLATSPTATVHGHITTLTKPAGQPFVRLTGTRLVKGLEVPFVEEIDRCPFCGIDVPRADAHEDSEVVLYTQGEPPNGDHQTTLAPHGLSAAQCALVPGLIDAHVP